MAFKVTDFKSNLKGGGARPSLFSVNLSYPTGISKDSLKSEFLIKGTTIPASTLGTYEIFFHGKGIKVAGDRTFDTWDTTIINDEDFGIRKALENWMKLISDHKLNTRDKTISSSEGENALYKKTLSVTQFAKNGNKLRKYEFFGAFPTALSTITLDWGTSEIEEYTCTWTYDSWNVGELSTGDVISNAQNFTGTTTGF